MAHRRRSTGFYIPIHMHSGLFGLHRILSNAFLFLKMNLNSNVSIRNCKAAKDVFGASFARCGYWHQNSFPPSCILVSYKSDLMIPSGKIVRSLKIGEARFSFMMSISSLCFAGLKMNLARALSLTIIPSGKIS